MNEKQFTGLPKFPITAEAQIIVVNDPKQLNVTNLFPREASPPQIKSSLKIWDKVISYFKLLLGQRE